MNELRERWEGVSLPGDYLLERWVENDGDAALFEASAGPEASPEMPRVAVRLTPQRDNDGAAQLGLWQRAKALEHPNLRRLLDLGRAELDGEIVLYAVMEKADDTLASALSHGPLSETESREVLDAVIGALRTLQSQGLAVRSLDPEHVVAVGDSIKVCTDALRDAPLDEPFRRELAAFWDQVSPSPTARRQEILRQAIGEPVPHADPVRLPAVQPPLPAEPPMPSAMSKPFESSPPYTAPRPSDVAPEAKSILPPPRKESRQFAESDTLHQDKRGTPKWIFVGAAAVVLLVLGLNLRHSPDAPAQAAPPTPVTTSVVPRTPSPVVSATPAPAPVKRTAPAAPEDVKPSPLQEASRTAPGKAMWRVIAFTYRTQEGARHKVEQVNEKHPQLKANVFAPREKKGYYLVALGGRMTRDEAIRMQRLARADRVARDVYIQNYSE